MKTGIFKVDAKSYVLHRLDTQVDGVKESKFSAFTKGREPSFAGVVSMRFEGRLCADLSQLYVDPGFRNRGFGSALIRLACAVAEEAGCVAISLCVHPKNRTVLPFYQLAGFSISHEYEDQTLMLTKCLEPNLGVAIGIEKSAFATQNALTRQFLENVKKACGPLSEALAHDMDHRNKDHSQWYKAVEGVRKYFTAPAR